MTLRVAGLLGMHCKGQQLQLHAQNAWGMHMHAWPARSMRAPKTAHAMHLPHSPLAAAACRVQVSHIQLGSKGSLPIFKASTKGSPYKPWRAVLRDVGVAMGIPLTSWTTQAHQALSTMNTAHYLSLIHI